MIPQENRAVPTDSPLPPGSILGVFGGGQLGRMFTQAAQRLGFRVHVYSPDAHSPAGCVADREFVGPMGDLERIEEFARTVDVATLEFENLPTKSIAAAEKIIPVRPGSHVLHTTQHRFREKSFLRNAGVPVGDFAPVQSLESLVAAVEQLGLPAVLKTSELGYDGKGQVVLRDKSELEAAWEKLGPNDCLLEAFVPFQREVSMLVARGLDGETVLYGPIENCHANHILDTSVLPAPATSPATAAQAADIATTVVQQLDAIGIICVELFELPSGELLVNEIAPRPHNSGHLTIEGCRTSQFEQQVRAITGLPLGSPESVAPAAMANLLGDLWFGENDQQHQPNWAASLASGSVLHLYGKSDPRRGRKMGHLTALGQSPESARQRVVEGRASLQTGSVEASACS